MKLNKLPLILGLLVSTILATAILAPRVQAQDRILRGAKTIGATVDGMANEQFRQRIARMTDDELIRFQAEPKALGLALPEGYEIQGVDLLGGEQMEADPECCTLEPAAAEKPAASTFKWRCIRVCFRSKRGWIVCVTVCR